MSTQGEVDIRTNPAVFKFFTLLQDEVHRFAITYMKKSKNKKMLASELMSVEGVGKQRYNLIIEKFKTIDRIKKATVEQLLEVKGMPENVAKRIFDYFNGE